MDNQNSKTPASANSPRSTFSHPTPEEPTTVNRTESILMNILTPTLKKSNLVFKGSRANGQYLFDLTQATSNASEENITIPLNMDTEFRSFLIHWLFGKNKGRTPITTQVRGITVSEGVIMTHPDFQKPRHPIALSGFHPVDYLNLCGYQASIRTVEVMPKDLPKVEFVIYGHFLLAEIMLIVTGEYRQDFLKLMNEPDPRPGQMGKPRFTMQRRLRAVTPGLRGDDDRVNLPWILTLDGQEYAVSISLMDTGALHGVASYKDVCEAAGIKLEAKDNFTSEQKARMDEMYQDRTNDFDSYALGDLYPYDALAANAENFKNIYRALGIEELYQPPKLTIGSTVRDLFIAKLQKYLGLEGDSKQFSEFVKKYIEPSSAQELKKNPTSTSALLAKVEGGRCRNNRPTAVKLGLFEVKKTNGKTEACLNNCPLVDLDISGCYGEGQRNQIYPIGKPEIVAFPATSQVNEYWTLRTFLKTYEAGDTPETWAVNKGELVSGAWFARVSTLKVLTNRQDYLASWFVNGKAGVDLLAKYVSKMKSDSETTDNEVEVNFNVEDGSLKIFNHEILNGLTTHDFIDWVMFVASDVQRKELLDNLYVTTAMVYPASRRVETIGEFMKAQDEWKGKNKVQRKGKGKQALLRFQDGECHTWMGVNLGDLLINDLLANRKLYPKKTPLNTLFKLCVNTLYGDMTSKFFNSANVCVGNNITARARALAWYMEKGLYGVETVTDGCCFELNRVVIELLNTGAVELVNLHRKLTSGDAHVKVGSIAGDTVYLDWVEFTYFDSDKQKQVTSNFPKLSFGETVLEPTLERKNGVEFVKVPAMEWIDIRAMEHLQNLFPKVDVLHAPSTSLKAGKDEQGNARYDLKPRKGQFEFEAKQYYDRGTFQGTANYLLGNPNGDVSKMRSYEQKKAHESYQNGKVTKRYDAENNPAKDFLNRLQENPAKVVRQVPFIKEAILKPSDYKNRLETWLELGLVPGDSFHKSGLLKEFSLSQFTFKTLSQYQAWDKAIFTRKQKYGQSIESLFLNSDGTLNYSKMVKAVDKAISEGSEKPFEDLAENKKAVQKAIAPHPSWGDLQKLRTILQSPETSIENDYSNH